ncbi:MAG: bifunctional UDP-N-acetylglucosamine diphosphorylase/glucosamine-1-phosphate N-acetyltransferase GlmU [Betaproteobacteria bacterium]|nr:bifunctional UDP-N-acetylglucosamine diphosphorylase/glucosamine-1-phosphate N-acetyltransferase GlmU [Betaproteobacteria bacterium]
MALNVVILAAGQGKRMFSERPKVLHLLAGRPLLAHVIATARVLGADRICVVYGHGGEQVPQAINDAGIVFVKQEPQLGTGHALMRALPHLGRAGKTLVLYGDVPLIRSQTLKTLVEAAMPRVVVLSAELDDPSGYGRVVRDKRGRIAAIVEDKDASASQRKIREVNTGIMVLPTARLAGWLAKLKNRNAQGEYYLTDVVSLALGNRITVDAVKAGDAWETLGVNSRAQLARLERIYQWQCANRLLEQGVTLIDPMRFDVRGNLDCGSDVRIDVNCVFEGQVRLGAGVEIGANCVLRNVEVGAGTRIEPFTHIDEATIGTGCRIGPFARIRPGTRLAEEVHIGNFVEVKASEIEARSKANHLAYVGDSTVGRDVNIGAGTITCNYDGANKHRTVIEDDVHIGSDVQLVAPVRLAKGVTIGAGTTVWKDTPSGGLVINAKTQEHRPGWKRPKKQERREE